MSERRICTETGKVIYTKAEATSIVNGLKGHNTASHIYRGSNKPSRKYFCKECGGYHTTHLKQTTEKGYHKKPMKIIYGKGYSGDYDDYAW